MGILKDERYNILTDVKLDHVYDPLPRGREFNPKDYESGVIELLNSHPSDQMATSIKANFLQRNYLIC